MINLPALFGGTDRERAFHEGQIRQLNKRRGPIELAHGLALLAAFGGGLVAAVASGDIVLGGGDELVAIVLRGGIFTMLLAAGVAVGTGHALARLDRRIQPHAQRLDDLWRVTPEVGRSDDDAR